MLGQSILTVEEIHVELPIANLRLEVDSRTLMRNFKIMGLPVCQLQGLTLYHSAEDTGEDGRFRLLLGKATE